MELKCLEVNQGRSANLKQKVSMLYDEYAKSGSIESIVYGEVEVDVDSISKQFARDVLELYRRPIQGRIKKANQQIKQTKLALDCDDCEGLLLLVNDGHEFLTPRVANWILTNTLSRGGYSSIDRVIYFTVNMTASHPGYSDDLQLWATLNRRRPSKAMLGFLERLRSAWFSHFSAINPSLSFSEHYLDDPADLIGIENSRIDQD